MAGGKPFKLDTELPITRGVDGKFREYPATTGAQPAESMQAKLPEGAWHPGVGQGTAPSGSTTMRFGPPPPPRSGVPFKITKP